MSRAALEILGVLAIIGVGCQSSAQVTPSPSPTPTRFDPTVGWVSYDNLRFGISLRHPPGLVLLLDDPDGSGAQFQGDGVMLNLVVNPRSETSAENLVSLLGDRGFVESRRSDIKKGPWVGLRVEGSANQPGLRLDEVVFIIQSGTSQLTMLALGEPPIDQEVIDSIWSSLVISGNEFSLSSALLDPASVSTFSPADGTFSFRYPTRWQAGAGSGDVVIVDPDDREGLLLTAGRAVDAAPRISEAVEDRLNFYRVAFKDVRVVREDTADIRGSTASASIGGTFVFQDGARGGFEFVMAISNGQPYYVEVIGLRSKLSAEEDSIQDILKSFALSPS